MRSGPLCALVVGIVLMLLVVLSRRLCRRGTSIPTATKPPKATRDPKPFAGLTHKPDCPACAQEAAMQPSASAPPAPPPRLTFTRGRRRHIDTTGQFCPQVTCAYHGRVGWGNIRVNGHLNGRRWRQLGCLGCQRHCLETHGTIGGKGKVMGAVFHGCTGTLPASTPAGGAFTGYIGQKIFRCAEVWEMR
jgi:hypothetical protein